MKTPARITELLAHPLFGKEPRRDGWENLSPGLRLTLWIMVWTTLALGTRLIGFGDWPDVVGGCLDGFGLFFFLLNMRYWTESEAYRARLLQQRVEWRKHQQLLTKYVNQYQQNQVIFANHSRELEAQIESMRSREAATSMAKINGMTGEEFERLCGMLLTNQGYHVRYTKRTGDFGADLILEKGNRKISVQCKRYRNKLNGKPIQEVVGSLKPYRCNEGWVMTNSHFTQPAMKLAQMNHIRLIDGSSLQTMIRDFSQSIRDHERRLRDKLAREGQMYASQAHEWQRELRGFPLTTTKPPFPRLAKYSHLDPVVRIFRRLLWGLPQ